MFPASILTRIVRVVFVGLVLALTAPAAAQSRPETRTQSAKKPKSTKPAKGKKGHTEAESIPAPEPVKIEDAARPSPEAAPSPKSESARESSVKAAGTSAAAKAQAVKDVKEEESAGGVKTYEFGAVEVEGRLRSPQILYFLRRVRAEFDAAALGHRSFLRELADTRNDPAFR